MPTLHLIHGYLGAGKSTFSRALADEKDALRLCPDEVLVARHGPQPVDDFGVNWRDIKLEMWRQAEVALAQGQDVVLDFGFWKREERDAARAAAARLGVEVVLYHVQSDPAVARARVIERSGKPGQLMIDGAAFDTLHARFETLADDEVAVAVTN